MPSPSELIKSWASFWSVGPVKVEAEEPEAEEPEEPEEEDADN